jgi:sporulation protein YlmC with PRC-barrel domain
MLHAIQSILNRPIEGTAGKLGSLDDVLFDSYTWQVRYLAVDAEAREILLAPEIVAHANWREADRAIQVPLTAERLAQSPRVDAARTISRQQERALADYFGWNKYWKRNAARRSVPAEAGAPPKESAPPAGATEREDESDLRSVNEVTGYRIAATDGEIGHLEDFILDLDRWIIRYLLVKTRNWLPGRQVLLSPAWIEDIDWEERHVRVNLSRGQIAASPKYTPGRPIERAYEKQLHESYGRPKYWLW